MSTSAALARAASPATSAAAAKLRRLDVMCGILQEMSSEPPLDP
jgi:hypothetical protein